MSFKFTRWVFGDSVTKKVAYYTSKITSNVFSLFDESTNTKLSIDALCGNFSTGGAGEQATLQLGNLNGLPSLPSYKISTDDTYAKLKIWSGRWGAAIDFVRADSGPDIKYATISSGYTQGGVFTLYDQSASPYCVLTSISGNNNILYNNLMIGTYTPTAGNEKLQVYGPVNFGNGTDATTTESDGTIVFKGAATVWNDAYVEGTSLRFGATAPTFAAIGATTIFGTRFDDASVQSIHGSLEIPHDYKEGTPLYLHIHWMPATTATAGNVRWGVEWTIANRGTVFPAATTTEVDSATAGVALAHTTTDIVTISGTGRQISDVIHFRIFRNGTHANDTFAANAFLSRIAIHYECDMVGSRSQNTKA